MGAIVSKTIFKVGLIAVSVNSNGTTSCKCHGDTLRHSHFSKHDRAIDLEPPQSGLLQVAEVETLPEPC